MASNEEQYPILSAVNELCDNPDIVRFHEVDNVTHESANKLQNNLQGQDEVQGFGRDGLSMEYMAMNERRAFRLTPKPIYVIL